MILGLPYDTFFWVVVVWIAAVIAAIVYGLTYEDTDTWLTLEDIFRKADEEHNHEP